MHIKICGLTDLEDALAAADLGADYLGFNFYPPSPRYLPPDACARLVHALRARPGPPPTLVGIFVDEAPARVAALLDACGLDLAQLHGRRADHAQLWGRAYRVWRGTPDEDPAALAAFSPGAPALLVDAHSPQAYGGTGLLADWEAAREVARRHPIFLAGGLTSANVAEAIARVRPWGVDAASGVESAPGRKDRAKMCAFIQAARRAAGEGMQPSRAQAPASAEVT